MRAELAGLSCCAVPFLRRAAGGMCWYYYTIVTEPVDKNARRISWSKSLRGTLFKTRRWWHVLVLLYQDQLIKMHLLYS